LDCPSKIYTLLSFIVGFGNEIVMFLLCRIYPNAKWREVWLEKIIIANCIAAVIDWATGPVPNILC
jgi:hypothetical protein